MEVNPDSLRIENGEEFKLFVEIKDKAGNATSQPRLNVLCKVSWGAIPVVIGRSLLDYVC